MGAEASDSRAQRSLRDSPRKLNALTGRSYSTSMYWMS